MIGPYYIEPHSQSSINLAVLLSGAVGAVVAAGLTLLASFYLDAKNKKRILEAELRRHRVNRLITASDGLRTSFFTASTLLEYHRVEMFSIEHEHKEHEHEIVKFGFGPNVIEQRRKANVEGTKLRVREAILRYNAEVSRVQATAKSLVESLDDPILPSGLYQRIRNTALTITSGHTTDVASIDERIQFFEEQYPYVKQLLQELESAIESEIIKPHES